MSINLYEVHIYTLCDGWINCWRELGQDGTVQPCQYKSIKEAQAEIDETIRDSQMAVTLGEIEEPDDPQGYRIYDVNNQIYVD